ncbi:hypothetical protein [Oceanicola sp. S124]|uniref:hypothetical protein n=1 Tax=Oceanicola sp. S124 TaxID=1042378 RepID=UPI00025596F6|nr:hypothetical protein [Oceanicola sp. S124]
MGFDILDRGLNRGLWRSEKALRRKMGGRRPLRRGSFDSLVARAGRELPGSARREARKIQAVKAQMQHPKLAARMDAGQLSGAFRRLDRAVAQWNPRKRRRNMWLDALAGYAFNMLLFLGLSLAFLSTLG